MNPIERTACPRGWLKVSPTQALGPTRTVLYWVTGNTLRSECNTSYRATLATVPLHVLFREAPH